MRNIDMSAVKNLLMPLGKVLLVTGSIFTSSHLLDNVVWKKRLYRFSYMSVRWLRCWHRTETDGG